MFPPFFAKPKEELEPSCHKEGELQGSELHAWMGILIRAHRATFSRLKPDVLWAQRNDTVLLTINLSDIRNEKLSLEENMFSFAGNAGPEGKFYAVQMTFHKEVVPQVNHLSHQAVVADLVSTQLPLKMGRCTSMHPSEGVRPTLYQFVKGQPNSLLVFA